MRIGSMFVRARAVQFAAVSALALAAGQANAGILYTTNFNAPTYSDGALVGQDGWSRTGTSTVNPLMVSNSATDGRVTLTTTGEDANRAFTPALTADSIYLSADFTVNSATATGDYFLHLSDGGTSNFNARIYARSSGSGFTLAMGTSSGTTGLVFGTTPLAFGTSYHIVARYDFVAGAANDTGALFVNPTDGLFASGGTAYVAATTIGTDAASISAVNLRQGGSTSAPAVLVSGLTVATIPTPGTIALLGLGGLIATLRRRD